MPNLTSQMCPNQLQKCIDVWGEGVGEITSILEMKVSCAVCLESQIILN